jgi:hypothetical protein
LELIEFVKQLLFFSKYFEKSPRGTDEGIEKGLVARTLDKNYQFIVFGWQKLSRTGRR